MHKNILAFTIDENYIEPFIVATQSFLEFHDTEKYTFLLLHASLKKYQVEKIEKYFQLNNLELIVKKIDDIFTNIAVDYHFNSVIFYRLLIPNMFKNYDKVLYIDSDIIFTDNIDEVFKIDLTNNILAAIPKTLMGIPEHMKEFTSDYFASGLLLMNIKLFNDNHIFEKIMKYLSTNYYQMPDQDALNATITDWVSIDIRYGLETSFINSSDSMFAKAKENPAIIQFSGTSKPWQYKNKHPYKKYYWKYLKMTPYKRYYPQDLTLFNLLKWMIPVGIKEFIKNIINR